MPMCSYAEMHAAKCHNACLLGAKWIMGKLCIRRPWLPSPVHWYVLLLLTLLFRALPSSRSLFSKHQPLCQVSGRDLLLKLISTDASVIIIGIAASTCMNITVLRIEVQKPDGPVVTAELTLLGLCCSKRKGYCATIPTTARPGILDAPAGCP